jgi:arylsulfatase A-like enzyme
MNNIVLILSDALRYDTAVANMGILGHLVEAKLASLYKMTGASTSRPMYETVHTGLSSSDHGINKDGAHGGTTPEQREVPLFWIQPNVKGRGDTGETISQLQIAPTVLKLLDVPIPETMKYPALI